MQMQPLGSLQHRRPPPPRPRGTMNSGRWMHGKFARMLFRLVISVSVPTISRAFRFPRFLFFHISREELSECLRRLSVLGLALRGRRYLRSHDTPPARPASHAPAHVQAINKPRKKELGLLRCDTATQTTAPFVRHASSPPSASPPSASPRRPPPRTTSSHTQTPPTPCQSAEVQTEAAPGSPRPAVRRARPMSAKEIMFPTSDIGIQSAPEIADCAVQHELYIAIKAVQTDGGPGAGAHAARGGGASGAGTRDQPDPESTRIVSILVNTNARNQEMLTVWRERVGGAQEDSQVLLSTQVSARAPLRDALGAQEMGRGSRRRGLRHKTLRPAIHPPTEH